MKEQDNIDDLFKNALSEREFELKDSYLADLNAALDAVDTGGGKSSGSFGGGDLLWFFISVLSIFSIIGCYFLFGRVGSEIEPDAYKQIESQLSEEVVDESKENKVAVFSAGTKEQLSVDSSQLMESVQGDSLSNSLVDVSTLAQISSYNGVGVNTESGLQSDGDSFKESIGFDRSVINAAEKELKNFVRDEVNEQKTTFGSDDEFLHALKSELNKASTIEEGDGSLDDLVSSSWGNRSRNSYAQEVQSSEGDLSFLETKPAQYLSLNVNRDVFISQSHPLKNGFDVLRFSIYGSFGLGQVFKSFDASQENSEIRYRDELNRVLPDFDLGARLNYKAWRFNLGLGYQAFGEKVDYFGVDREEEMIVDYEMYVIEDSVGVNGGWDTTYIPIYDYVTIHDTSIQAANGRNNFEYFSIPFAFGINIDLSTRFSLVPKLGGDLLFAIGKHEAEYLDLETNHLKSYQGPKFNCNLKGSVELLYHMDRVSLFLEPKYLWSIKGFGGAHRYSKFGMNFGLYYHF